MSRVRVVIVTLLAGLLVLDGGGGTPEVSLDAAGSAVEFDAQRVATILERVNPSLSSEQRQRIGSAVERNSARYGIDAELITAVLIVESNARPWARSGKGAVGLMQVMPYMAAPLGLAGNLTTIEKNIEAGCLILADNIRRLGEEDGISAYFWGSDIRGVAYLHRVREAQTAVRRFSES